MILPIESERIDCAKNESFTESAECFSKAFNYATVVTVTEHSFHSNGKVFGMF